ncbi:unnamed protein product, partial [Brenthis ino]
MHRSIILLFLCSLVLVEFSNSYLMKARTFDRVSRRDIPGSPSQDAPEELASASCAKVGEFCINHNDCCSNGCLGFKRRCVSS